MLALISHWLTLLPAYCICIAAAIQLRQHMLATPEDTEDIFDDRVVAILMLYVFAA